ncbi:MAG: tRNA (adenosine(37)-N6)-threonylcarbamoyltransferase complex ATPase subunit type 1 TsaE [Solirubrobacteraceae bacterium]
MRSAGPTETEALAADAAARLVGGDVVLLSGELGAGKTTFVRGAARALGVSGPVVSPTFTVGALYQGRGVTVAHLDLYRLSALEDEDPALLAEYLSGEPIAFVEWPERAVEEALGRVVLRVALEHLGGDARRVRLDWRLAEGRRR